MHENINGALKGLYALLQGGRNCNIGLILAQEKGLAETTIG